LDCLVKASVLVQDSKAADGPGQWIRVGRFGDHAEGLAQQLVKGVEVYVEGRLKMNTWTAADGTTRSGLNVTAWSSSCSARSENEDEQAHVRLLVDRPRRAQSQNRPPNALLSWCGSAKRISQGDCAAVNRADRFRAARGWI